MARIVLTDIEGTTSSIAFVKDVLFPWARARLPAWLAEHADDPEVAPHVASVRDATDAGASIDEVAATLQAWIDADRKATPLKAIQGRMWAEGYRTGAFTAHVYDDALLALRAWHAAGLPIHVYSSGSVAAQELFFGHTTAGDLRPLFSGHFDTTTGPKKEAASYATIAEALGEAPAQVVFLTDIRAEADAARAAGMATVWVVRDGMLPRSDEHLVVRTLTAVPVAELVGPGT